MKVQPKYVAQHESDFFADGRDERPIVPGTVPIGYIMPKTNGHAGEYASTTASNSPIATGENGFSDSTSYFDTGKIGDSYGDGLPDEVKKDIPALLARGQQRFNINCAVCHGAVGMGNGIVTQFGLVGPANFQQAQYRTMPDGQIFNTITFGKEKGRRLRAEHRRRGPLGDRGLHPRPAALPKRHPGRCGRRKS